MIFATVDDLITRFDVRNIGQLASDNNVPLNQTQLNTSTRVLSALQDASGMIQSALYVAYKYIEADLETLDEESVALLKRICCDIAFVYLASVRGYSYKDKFPLIEESFAILQKLRNGERVLNLPNNEKAGLTQVAVINQAQAGLITSKYRYFPFTYPYGY